MAISYKPLLRLYEAKGKKATRDAIVEMNRVGDIRTVDHDFGKLFTDVFGYAALQECREAGTGNHQVNKIFEAAGAVATDAFSHISGQIVYTTVLEGYEMAEFVFSKMFPDVPTKFKSEKVPGISNIGDQAQVIAEGAPYPFVGVSENYVQTADTEKRGYILQLTKEAVFFDRTGLLIDQAKKLGEFIGLNKEKRAIDAFIDANTTAHRYNWLGSSYASYQGSAPWVNVTTSNALVDWTDVEAAELVFSNLKDPFTNEPILLQPDTLVVTPQLMHTAKRIVSATENRLQVGGFATSGNLTTQIAPNTISNYKIVSSPLLKARMELASIATTTWYLARPDKVVEYRQNWPLTVTEAPANTYEEFHNDIVMQFKASEMGAYFVREPRYSIRCSA